MSGHRPAGRNDPAIDGHEPGFEQALIEVTQDHGVSDEQLALLLGWPVEEVARRRRGVATDAETEAPAEEVLPAPRVEPGGKLDLVVRAVAAAYLVFLLAAVLLYKSAFLKMVTVSPLLTCYSLVVVCYITSRFLFSSFYRRSEDHGLSRTWR